MFRTITDTADRIRITDQILLGGQWLLVENIADAQTPTHPGRLALHVIEVWESLAATPRISHVYAGETVTFRPGNTHLANAVGLRPGGVELPVLYSAA